MIRFKTHSAESLLNTGTKVKQNRLSNTNNIIRHVVISKRDGSEIAKTYAVDTNLAKNILALFKR